MKKKITLKQIARELDVSISTVSKALKDSKEISQETREKIQAFAKLYNYKPNNIALSLKNRKTRTIAVIIPEVVHHFFAKVIKGIEQVANDRGYHVMIALSNESFDKEVINMETLVNGSIDGFIISLAKETLQLQDYHHLNETINQGIPVVMFDRVVNDILCDKVIVDDQEGAKNAVKYLIDKGCRRILLITTKDYINVGKFRTHGYLQALAEYEVEADSQLIIKVPEMSAEGITLEKLEKELDRTMANNLDIDAIFAVNEIYAAVAMKVLRKQGKSIPQDIKMISFSDGVLSRHSNPSLTTVSQHGRKIGEAAANLLIDKLDELEDEEAFKTKVIKTALIERESTL